jgi:hypothetical protein
LIVSVYYRIVNYQIIELISGSSSFGRAIAFQAIGGQFEPGLPLFSVCGK